VFRWLPLLWTSIIVAFFISVVGSAIFGWAWTGFNDRTLWDWLKLLLAAAVPAVIGYLGARISSLHANLQRDAEEQRAQDETLRTYLDQMGQMLLDKDQPLRQSKEGDEVSILARARTLTALSQLNGKRKGTLMQFLREARLIQGRPGMESGKPGWTQQRPIIGLTSADLSDADLIDADLTYVMLGEASLRGANLRGADLSNAVLFDTDLTDANLFDATVSWRGGLDSCTLKGATMPNGQIFEEWLKWFMDTSRDLVDEPSTEAGLAVWQKDYQGSWLKDQKERGDDRDNCGTL
jgi:hypothetical protein